ncbi:EexN family lipoprotein [Pectobacterium brasiliense]|uniref:EexN family lipoprotein n=1 Tax=Pectobacterium brasiliense TaxID=180957 RepID=UPI001969D2C1|nr:EexN family lipoprotein [Pectobacterium brasiliense]MBN3343337.1 EexN family lipoprotein [Pectobacterium brasiliense]
MKLIPILLLTLSLPVLAEETKDIDWYKQHDKERRALIEQCKKDQQLRITTECRTAMAVEAEIVALGK